MRETSESSTQAAFTDLFEVAPEAILIAGADGRFTAVNAAACDLLGYARDELLSKEMSDLFPPEDIGALAVTRERLRTTGAAEVDEWTQLRKDGTSLVVEASTKILPDGRWQTFVRDVTQRKRREEAQRLSGMASLSTEAVITIDDDQRVIAFNEGAEHVFGYARAEVLGGSLDVLIPERYRANHRSHLKAFAAGATTVRRMGERATAIMGQRKNGEEFPVEAEISRLRIGEHTVLTVALREIAPHIRIEQQQRLLAAAGAALSASLDYEETLATIARLVVRGLADWCAIEFMEVPQRLQRLKVFSADAGQAALCTRLEQSPADRPLFARSSIAGRRPWLIERVTPHHLESIARSPECLSALSALGAESMMVVPLLMRGQLLGVLALVSTTSCRFYREDDLHYAEALAERVAVALENARLYRESVEASQLRDHVLGVVAHDLRNPLGVILMQVASLRAREGEPERRSRKPADAIYRAATRMNRLIQDLLDIARMEDGQLSVERTVVAAGPLMLDAVEAQQPLAESSGVELRIEPAADLQEVWCDRDRLLQVFENLIGNAIKFSSEGGRVTIGASAREHEAVFFVVDNGPGIGADDLPHIFDRFWQGNPADHRGAGLGLPIAKGIVEAHGGRVWAESDVGRGTKFFFSIPDGPRATSDGPRATEGPRVELRP